MEKYLGILGVGVAVFLAAYHYNRRILDWLRFSSLGTRDYVVERLGLMFIELDPDRALLFMFLLGAVPGLLVFLLLYPLLAPAIAFGLLVAGLGWASPRLLVDWLYQRRVERFLEQMVDALDLMSNGLKSGLSIVQAVGLVTQEMPDPMRQEMGLVLSENRLGVSVEDSFNNLSKRIKSEDVDMFVTSVTILRETGGNLAETFDTISRTIRDRIKVQKKIQAMTAQGLAQGMIMIAITPVMGLILYSADPELMAPVFSTVEGWAIIAVVLLLNFMGFLMIKWIVRVDV